MKTILYVHTGDWPSPSPSTVFVTGASYGYALHAPCVLFVRNNTDRQTADVFRDITGKQQPDNLEIIRTGFSGSKPGHFGHFVRAVRFAGRLVRSGRLGAVITRSVGFLPYLYYIRKRYKIPCLFETHDFFGDLDFRADLRKSFRIRRNSLYERIFFPRLDGLICLTEPQRTLFAGHYPSTPAVVAHTGITEVFKPAEKRKRRVCYIGSLDPHKGVGTLLEAMREVDNTIHLMVIGGKSDDEIAAFRDLVVQHGLSERVIITGWLNHQNVAELLRFSMAGVVPLADTVFNRHITSPLKILDCMACSVPIVASDLPSVRDYIEDGQEGILFKPDDMRPLSSAIEKICKPEVNLEMSRAVFRHAETLLWERRGRAVIDFIGEFQKKV